MKKISITTTHRNILLRLPALSAWVVALMMASITYGQDNVVWSETFETDGEGSRYVTEGTASFNAGDPGHPGGDQVGPVYWTRVVEGTPDFVGVPAPTAEKRALMAWDGSIVEEDVTDAGKEHIKAVIDWLTGGKANANIVTVGAVGDFMIDFLEGNGHTIIEDDGGDPPADADAFVYAGGASGRYADYAVPGLVYNSSDLDDLLVSSIGTAVSMELPDVAITTPDHPAAGGQTGTAAFVNGPNTFQGLGSELPQNSTVVAAYVQTVTASVRDLDEADALFDGSTPNTGVQEASTNAADIVLESDPDSQIAFFDWDFGIPGDPTGGFAVRSTGSIEVESAGTYSLALGSNDGGRLRIDLDGNGLDSDDNVILQDRRGAWQYSGPVDVEFTAGTFDFEWVAFNDQGNFGSEILVALDTGGNAPPVSDSDWDILSTSSANVKLNGNFTIQTYVPDLPPQEIETPFTVVLESPEDGGSVFGGGPFTGWEGDHYYAGSALNKFSGDDGIGTPKKIIWNETIDISGVENPHLVVSVAATFLDFETGDYLQFFIDEGDDPFIWFTAPSGDDKFFNDLNTNPASPTRLNLSLQDVAYPIPDDVNEINLRVESVTTWWNEIVAFDNIRIVSGEPDDPGGGGTDTAILALDGVPDTGSGLDGRYWQAAPASVLNLKDLGGDMDVGLEIMNNSYPTGTFTATGLTFQGGNDLTPIKEWLGSDGESFVGTEGNMGRRTPELHRIHPYRQSGRSGHPIRIR